MSRRLRVLRNIGIGLALLLIVVIVASIRIVQTDWFRNYVKQQIITSAEASTGGRAEIGSFAFDWRHLEAVVTNFVLHGKEPAQARPFFRAPRIQLDLRLFTSIHHWIDLAYLGIEQPEANIVILPDGQSNIPTPRQPRSANQAPLQPVVNAAIGHFELTKGILFFADGQQKVDIRGDDLKAQLWFSTLQQGYRGQLSFQPLYLASGRNTPVNFAINLPVAIQSDRIDFSNATISTPATSIRVNGSVRNLRNPTISAQIQGHIGLADLKNTANLPLTLDSRATPAALDLDANATLASNDIDVKGLRLSIGHSSLEASGILRNQRGDGALEFRSTLVLGELGRLANLSSRPDGVMNLNGTAKLDVHNNYEINGNVAAKDVSFQQGAERIEHVGLFSALHLDRHNVDLNGLRLAVFGGELAGNLSLQDLARYRFHGDLRTLNLRTAAHMFGQKQFPYDGSVSGPVDLRGDLKVRPFEKGLTAETRLAITPGRQGVPVSGRLNADYDGAADNLRIDHSYLALPHTRLDFNGSAGTQLNVSASTSDLNDLLVATPWDGKSPVSLNDHEATFTGAVTGHLTSPRITGQVRATEFSVEGRRFDSLSLDAAVSRTGAAVRAGSLKRGAMQTQFEGEVGLRDWRPTSSQALHAQATVRNGDLADLLALAGQPSAKYSGAVSASLQIGGTVGNPTGGANFLVTNGTLYGEPFDQIKAQVKLADQLVTVSSASLEAGTAHVDLTAQYQHRRDSFTTGQLHAHVQCNPVDLAQLRELQKHHPNTSGTLQMNADFSADVDGSEFLLTALNGNVSARAIGFEGTKYGDLNATASTGGKMVQYQLTSNFAGSNIHVSGNTQLTRDYPTTADANIRNLPVEAVLAAARRKDVPAKGNLSGTAHFNGTKDAPQGNVDLDLANAVIYEEPLDHVRLKASYQPTILQVGQAEIAAGPARIDLTGRFDHPQGRFEEGTVQFNVNSSNVNLARIQNVQSRRPGLGGTLDIKANGAVDLRASEPKVQLKDLNANLGARSVTVQGKNYGDLTLNANSEGGRLNFALASNLAGASIQGRGNAQLTDHYPVDAQLAFNNVEWTKVRELIGQGKADGANFEISTDGQANVQGPLRDPDAIRASVQLSRLELTSISGAGPAIKPVSLKNQGAISATLDHQTVRIANAHMTGPQTDIQVTGTASLKTQAMDLNVNANANLALLESFDRDISSSGNIVLASSVRGTISNPLMNGRLELHNGSLNYTGFSNGISNANGIVTLNGDSASVQNLTAETGGGKLTFGGFVVMAGNPRFALRARATSVRIALQPGVSVFADGNLSLSGTRSGSQLTGTASVVRIAYAPRTDLGSFLTRAAPPVQSGGTPSPLLDNMKLDVRVQTSDALLVQASLAQNLQGHADLRIRGTASHPGVLGRVTFTEGTLTFFGTNYTLNSGTIAFYNPIRIDPILDVNLQTHAQGVDVTIHVTGPVDNLKLSYTSDPPLQFQEIIALLAAGQTPTTDPTILANQPSQPPQTFQQMGETALLTGAVTDPVASRLQRVFGVTQLRISPAFTTGTQLPTAAVTLQQKVASNITLTYSSTLSNANAQTIGIEVTLNPQWSAVATRDENGILSVNLLYRRQIR